MILMVIIGLVLLRIIYTVGEIICERDWPRNTVRGLITALFLLVLGLSAFGQAVRVDIPLLTSGPNVPMFGGPLPSVLWLSNATIQICAHPATLSSCSYVPTYTDATASVPCPGTQQIVNLPGNTCSSSSGLLGNIGFWYGGGTVDYIVTSSYGTYGPYTVTGLNGSGNFVSTITSAPQTMIGPLNVPVLNQVFHVQPVAGDIAAPANAAIAQCSGTQGCDVILDNAASSATISTTILVNKSNITLECASPYRMATHAGFSAAYVVEISGATNVTLKGCSFDVSNVSVGIDTIFVFNSSFVNVDDNRMYSSMGTGANLPVGVRTQGGNAGTATHDVTFSNNYATVPWVAYSVGDFSHDISFIGNHSTASSECFDFNGAAVDPPSAWGISFTGNTCAADTNSSFVESASDVTITGNIFDNDGGSGNNSLIIHSVTAFVNLGVSVSGNIFKGSNALTYAINLSQNVQDFAISGNTIKNYSAGGMYLDASASSLAHGTISGNHFFSNGSAGILFNSVSSGVANISVTGNDYSGETYSISESGGVAPFAIKEVGDVGAFAHFTDACTSCVLDFAGSGFGTTGPGISVSGDYVSYNGTDATTMDSGVSSVGMSGSVSVTLGGATIVGTSPVAPVCTTGIYGTCTPRSGMFQFTTGTGVSAVGTVGTINFPARQNLIVCSMNLVTAAGGAQIPVNESTASSNAGVVFYNYAGNLSSSTVYQLWYTCP